MTGTVPLPHPQTSPHRPLTHRSIRVPPRLGRSPPDQRPPSPTSPASIQPASPASTQPGQTSVHPVRPAQSSTITNTAHGADSTKRLVWNVPTISNDAGRNRCGKLRIFRGLAMFKRVFRSSKARELIAVLRVLIVSEYYKHVWYVLVRVLRRSIP